MDYEKVLGEHKFPIYEELKTGLIRLIDEGKISREDAARLLPELRESEDERIRKELLDFVKSFWADHKEKLPQSSRWVNYLEKQKENPMPNSTELIEMWHKAKAILKEKDFRGDEWRLAQNAFMDGFARGTCVKFEKQKEQKPAEKQDYSGLNDLERAIHRGFLSAGVENVSITIIKETARECLAQMNPAEWNDTDMKEARDSLISVCRDWERGQKTTLLPIAAVRARYFLEHLTEPKPAGWSEEDERIKSCIGLALTDVDEQRFKDFGTTLKDCLAWLKSLRPQPQGTYKLIVHNIYEMLKDKDFFDIPPSHRVSLLNDIRVRCKNADEQAEILGVPSWKPSEEQMGALSWMLENARANIDFDPLKDLYEQLKKL